MLIKVQTGLFVLMTVSNKPSQQMHDKIERATMAGMPDLRDILELVNNRFNDRSLAQQQFIRSQVGAGSDQVAIQIKG